jgi:hypothetical protein
LELYNGFILAIAENLHCKSTINAMTKRPDSYQVMTMLILLREDTMMPFDMNGP